MVVKIEKRKLIILGAGFAGIRVVQDLLKKNANQIFDITLVDRRDTHVFQGDLYEVATAFNKKITNQCLTDLRETVATPIKDLIDFKKVKFLKDEVLGIDHTTKKLRLKKTGSISYDYLVVALGSETNYFDIPGLKDHSFDMKTVEDALKINCHLDQFFRELWEKGEERDVYISVGGGGATGVELTAELATFLRCLAKKYHYPMGKIHLQLIEGSKILISLDKKGTDLVLNRLSKLGVNTFLERYIDSVSKNEITLRFPDGKKENIPSDFLVWTGGVMVNRIVQDSLGSKSKRGAMKVNPYLQSEHDKNIFVAGDNAFFQWGSDRPLPMVAQIAYQQGALVARNLLRISCGEALIRFEPKSPMYLIPLGGKYALLNTGKRIFVGRWVWLLKRLVYFKYALSILPFWKALAKFAHSTRIFTEND